MGAKVLVVWCVLVGLAVCAPAPNNRRRTPTIHGHRVLRLPSDADFVQQSAAVPATPATPTPKLTATENTTTTTKNATNSTSAWSNVNGSIADNQLGSLGPCIEDGSTLSPEGMILRPGQTESSRFVLPPITTFNVLSWNLFLRPRAIFDDAQQARVSRVRDVMFGAVPSDDLDLIAFQEVFDDASYAQLVRSFADHPSGWRHATLPLTRNRGLVSTQSAGGVVLISRWPIDRQANTVFNCMMYPDSFTQKGVLYARISKMENGERKPFHIFATQLQSSMAGNLQEQIKEVQTRQCQARQLRQFILKQNIPHTDPVLIVGDLSINLLNTQQPFTDELFKFTELVNATMPLLGGPTFSTSNTQRHALLGRDGSADQYGCGAECELLGNCSCIPPAWTEYVLLGKEFQQPVNESAIYVLDLHTTPFEAAMSQSPNPTTPSKAIKRMLTQLSDHDPIVKFFKFLH